MFLTAPFSNPKLQQSALRLPSRIIDNVSIHQNCNGRLSHLIDLSENTTDQLPNPDRHSDDIFNIRDTAPSVDIGLATKACSHLSGARCNTSYACTATCDIGGREENCAAIASFTVHDAEHMNCALEGEMYQALAPCTQQYHGTAAAVCDLQVGSVWVASYSYVANGRDI